MVVVLKVTDCRLLSYPTTLKFILNRMLEIPQRHFFYRFLDVSVLVVYSYSPYKADFLVFFTFSLVKRSAVYLSYISNKKAILFASLVNGCGR